jgi:hypothetical protein
VIAHQPHATACPSTITTKAKAAAGAAYPPGIQEIVGARSYNDLGLLLYGEVGPAELRVDVLLVKGEDLHHSKFRVMCYTFVQDASLGAHGGRSNVTIFCRWLRTNLSLSTL